MSQQLDQPGHTSSGSGAESARISDIDSELIREGLADTDICIWNFDLRTGHVQRSHLPRVLGYETNEVPATGEAWRELLHPDDEARAMDALNKHLTGQSHNLECEYRVRGKNGQYYWLHDRGHIVERDEQGQPLRIVGSSVNISRQKHVEDQLRASESQLRLLVRQLPAILWTTDPNLVITSSMGSGLSAIGLRDGQLVGQTIQQYLQVEDEAYTPLAKHRQALMGEAVGYEFEWLGTVFQVHVQPMRSESGEIIGSIGLAYDVTERKRHEQRLLHKAEVERLFRRELDHRVRNNLSTLISLVELTAQNAHALDDFAATIAGRIRAMASAHDCLSGDRSAQVGIRSLLETLVPNPFVGRIVYTGKDVAVAQDRINSLAMVLHELLTNSIKHGALSKDDGSIIVQCETDTAMELPIAKVVWQEKNGPRIEESPLFGTGVLIVEGIVRSDLQGEIAFAFEPEGAKHTIRIPVRSPDTPPPPDEPPAKTTADA